MDRRLAVGAGVLGVIGLALVGLMLSGPDGGPPPKPPPHAKPAKPAKAPPVSARQTLRRPPDVEAPEVPDERPPAAQVTPDVKLAMNTAMDAVIQTARRECLGPWVTGQGRNVELVFDAVLWDGRLVDFGLRSLGDQVPADVVSCVADAVWYSDWPEWELAGEMRLQRSIELEPAR